MLLTSNTTPQMKTTSGFRARRSREPSGALHRPSRKVFRARVFSGERRQQGHQRQRQPSEDGHARVGGLLHVRPIGGQDPLRGESEGRTFNEKKRVTRERKIFGYSLEGRPKVFMFRVEVSGDSCGQQSFISETREQNVWRVLNLWPCPCMAPVAV